MGIIGVGSFSQQDGVCKNLGRASAPALTDAALSPLAVYKLNEGSGAFAFNSVGTNASFDNLVGPFPQRLFKGSSTYTGTLAWHDSTSGVTDDYTAGPFTANVVASRFLFVDGADRGLSLNFGFLPAGTYTMSLYAKSNTGLAQSVRMSSDNTGTNSGIQTVAASGWTRLTYTFTADGSTKILWFVYRKNGDGDIDISIYGAKLNTGGSATAYVAPQFDVCRGNNATTPGSSAPTWTSTGLTFGSGKFCAGTTDAITSTSQLSVYAVGKFTTDSSGFGPLVAEEFDDSRFYLQCNTNALESTFGTTVIRQYGVKGQDGTRHVFAMTYDGANLKLYIDDALVAVKAAASLSAIAIRRLYLGDFNTLCWTDEIGAAAVYTTGHTAKQVATVGGLLRAVMATKSASMSPLAKFVVWEGDSITDPATNSLNANSYGPKTMKASTKGAQGSVVAVTGSTLTDLTARAATIDAMFATVTGTRILHVLIGRNDLNPANNLTAAQFVALLKAYCLARKAATTGLKVVVGTVLPSTLTGFNTLRNAANTLIAADPSFYDAIADYAADATMGIDGNGSTTGPWNTTYYTDGTHPTAAGQALLAVVAQAALDALL